MAISGTIRKDIVYPMLGDAVTVAVDALTAGNRVRWRVKSAPRLSKVTVYDARKPNDGYLPSKPSNGGLLTPDTHGEYVLTAVEQSFQSHIPHFSNDPTNALEEWAETATEDYSVYVGTRMVKTFGDGQNSVELVAHVIATSSVSQGPVSYWYDPDMAPVLQNPSTPQAASAMAATSVQDVIDFYGGKGFVGHEDIVTSSSFAESPYALLGRLIAGFNLHCGYTTNAVHGAADAANVMSAVAAPTDLATLCSYLITFTTKLQTHALLAAPTHPNGASAITITSDVPTDLSTAVKRLIELRNDYYLNHRTVHTSLLHSSPGDGVPANREFWQQPLWSDTPLDEAIAYAVALADAYDGHLGTTTVSAAYHAAADTDNVLDFSPPLSITDLIVQVNAFADALESHAANLIWTTRLPPGSAYHAKVDAGCKVATRASDAKTAVDTLYHALWAYMHHVDVNGAWHGGSVANGGVGWVGPIDCVSRLQVEFLNRLTGHNADAVANLLTAVDDLLRVGFTTG